MKTMTSRLNSAWPGLRVPGIGQPKTTSSKILSIQWLTATADGLDTESSSSRESANRAPLESEADRRRRLEAILLLSREPLPSRRLVSLAGLADATEVRTLTRQLNELYETDGSAFRIEENAGGVQILTRPFFSNSATT